MTLRSIEKPAEDEYPPYAAMYIGLLPDDGLVLSHMKDNLDATLRLIGSIPEDRLFHRYAQSKWTIKEILVHIIDDERIYGYRALRFARNDKSELPGFEQDDYARYSGANEREVGSILEEYSATRRSTISFFGGLDQRALLRSGVADSNRVSVRALAYHIAGHELHHFNVIRERYL